MVGEQGNLSDRSLSMFVNVGILSFIFTCNILCSGIVYLLHFVAVFEVKYKFFMFKCNERYHWLAKN